MSSKQIGTVKWFNDKKGFGFLVDPDGNDVFVHHRSIEPGTEGYKSLNEGEKVEYLPTQSAKGIAAAEVFKTQ